MSRALTLLAIVTLLVAAVFASASSNLFKPERFQQHRHVANTAVGATTPSLIFNRATGSEIYTTPLVVDSNIYVGNAKGQVVSVHRSTGLTNWTFTATVPSKGDDQQDRVYAQPTLAASKLALFVADSTGTLYNIDLSAGAVDYKFDVNGEPVVAKPLVVGASNVVVATYAGVVYNFDLTGDGSQAWNYTVGDFVSADPILAIGAAGAQIILIPAHDGNIVALDAATGKLLYKAATQNFNAIATSCVQDSARFVYCAVNGGEVFKMNSTTGDFAWKVRVNGSPSAGPVLSADGSMIYFPADFSKMVALTTSSGSVAWRYDAKDFVLRTPAAVNPNNGNVVFGAEVPFTSSSTAPGTPTIVSVDGKSGQQQWQLSNGTAGDAVSTGVYVDATMIVVGTKQGNVMAFSN